MRSIDVRGAVVENERILLVREEVERALDFASWFR
jgi:hypothetical protein